jgi:hypothetical protein
MQGQMWATTVYSMVRSVVTLSKPTRIMGLGQTARRGVGRFFLRPRTFEGEDFVSP